MGITIDYTATCEGCGRIKKTHFDWSISVIDELSSYSDVWGPGLPERWMQATRDNETPLLFHSRDCYKDWLRSTKQLDALAEFENAVWIA